MSNAKRANEIVKEIMAKGDVRPALKSTRASNIFADGNCIYSYGKHYLAAIYIGNTWLINTDRWSMSTGRHLHLIRDAFRNNNVDNARVISAPLDVQGYGGTLIQKSIKRCGEELKTRAEKLEKTRNGSGNNLRIKAEIAALEETEKRLVILEEMTGGII